MDQLHNRYEWHTKTEARHTADFSHQTDRLKYEYKTLH